jgi:glycosyltransferase involved in cell wall biosynthesis
VNRVLLTVSGTVPDDLEAQVAAGRRPRVDYLELATAMGADLVDHGAVARDTSPTIRVVRKLLGANVALAVMCFRARKRYGVIITDGEQVGLPLAALLRWRSAARRCRHVMIVHIMSVKKKSTLFRFARLGRGIDRYVVYATAQRRFLVDELHVDPDDVRLHPFMVDTAFFDPHAVEPVTLRPTVCAAGLECRDYPTMLRAVDGLDARVVLAAASPWSKRSTGLDGAVLPSNVEVVRLDLFQLRQLYADSSVVVMPLQPVEFQAGITTILEAMAMARPVVCTRTAGQTDTIDDGVNGVYVAPGDAPAMRTAIERLLADERARAELGAAARDWTVAHADVAVYAASLAELVDDVLASLPAGARA